MATTIWTRDPVTFTKLRSGEWGVRGPAVAVQEGTSVEVAKRDGTVTMVTVARVLWTDGQTSIAALSGSRTSKGRSRQRACRTGGNCSSFGSGRSCGGYDCDGF